MGRYTTLIIGKFKYEIDENNAIRIWNLEIPNENDAPFLFQPNYPDYTPWESKEAAEEWAINEINTMLNPPVEEESL